MNMISRNMLKRAALSMVIAGVAGSFISGCFEVDPVPPMISSPATPEGTGLQDSYNYPSVVPVALTSQDVVFNGALDANIYLDPERNGIHENTYNTDVSDMAGPTDSNLTVITHRMTYTLQSCPTVLLGENDTLIGVCLGFGYAKIVLVNGNTLELLAEKALPPKGNVNIDPQLSDASGGGYTHLLANGELLVAPYDKTIRTYSFTNNRITETSRFELASHVPAEANITDAVPDYDGNMWFTTSTGIIGYVNASDQVVQIDVGVSLQNQVALDASGVYFSTFEEFYKVEATNSATEINIISQVPYDHSAGGTTGVVSPGTGTTPTLFGANDDLVSISDNALGQLHVNVYRRSDLSLVCAHPIFAPGEGATENSAIGYSNTLVIQNNDNWDGFLGNPLTITPGLAKVNVTSVPAGTGLGTCETEWTAPIATNATPILSTVTGLIYSISSKAGNNYSKPAHYLAAIDYVSGEIVFEKWIGNGKNFDSGLTGGFFTSTGSFVYPTREGLALLKQN